MLQSRKGGVEFHEINGHFVTYNDNTHTYIVDGEQVRSITQYIAQTSENVYRNVPEHILERAAQKGTEFHEMIEFYEKEKKVPAGATHEFYRYMFERVVIDTVVAQEQIVLVDVDGELLAGRFDLLAIIDGKRVLIDFKRNSKAYKDKYEKQLKLYAKGVKQTYGTTVDRCEVWRFYNEQFQKIVFE